MARLGVVQGRLSPMVGSKIQAFPVEHWESEFDTAAKCGFEIIEWMVDVDKQECNPLFTKEGRTNILRQQKNSGIQTPSVCCDYFMEHPLQKTLLESFSAKGMLLELCRICPEVGISMIELPMIGKTGLKFQDDRNRMLAFLDFINPILEQSGLVILLETDLNPDEMHSLMKRVNKDRVKVNYDMGNSAYWAFDSKKELELYGENIGNVHIKDCTPEDYSVELGHGNVDFDLIFSKLKDKQYNGDFILQAARGNDDIALAIQYREFSLKYINQYML